MDTELKRPRYFKEANSHFKLPGGYSPAGILPGIVFMIFGFGLGFASLIVLGVVVAIYLCKKIGEDENYLKSVLRHLWVYKGMRFIVASPRTPPSKVIVFTRKGQCSVQDWLNNRISTKGSQHGTPVG